MYKNYEKLGNSKKDKKEKNKSKGFLHFFSISLFVIGCVLIASVASKTTTFAVIQGKTTNLDACISNIELDLSQPIALIQNNSYSGVPIYCDKGIIKTPTQSEYKKALRLLYHKHVNDCINLLGINESFQTRVQKTEQGFRVIVDVNTLQKPVILNLPLKYLIDNAENISINSCKQRSMCLSCLNIEGVKSFVYPSNNVEVVQLLDYKHITNNKPLQLIFALNT